MTAARKLSAPERLPASFMPVAEMLGDTALLALLEAHGGTRLYVPEKIGAHDPLAVLLGLRPAQELVSAYGRDTISVPLCKRWRMALLRRQGLTYASIGRRLGMHEQSVYLALRPGKSRAAKKPDAEAQLRFDLD